METILFVVGAAAVAAAGVWARVRFGGLRGTLLAAAVAAVIILALVAAFGEGPDGWGLVLVIPVVFVLQTLTQRRTRTGGASL